MSKNKAVKVGCKYLAYHFDTCYKVPSSGKDFLIVLKVYLWMWCLFRTK